MPAKYYRIFGFDQTSTKKAIPPELIQLDSDHTLAIATYHNNPDDIAHVLQTILKKNITFREIARGYELVLMSKLPSNEENQAEVGKIYLSSEDGGKYIVHDINGNKQQGTLGGVDLTQLEQIITYPEFKKTILEIISKAGHTLARDTIKEKNITLVGVHVYDIEEHEYPLLIAHIPQIDQEYFSAKNVLNIARGKNYHIELLRTYALKYNVVDENTYCDFFDDTTVNIGLAANFKEKHRLNSHLVKKDNPYFTVDDPVALRASLARGNASLSTFILEDPMLVSGIAGLLVAVGVLLAFALVAPPLTAVAVLTATGCGLFAAAATYYVSTLVEDPDSTLII